MEYHTSLLASLGKPLYEAWDFDFLFGVHDGPWTGPEQGRCTDMGHADYAADGSDRRAAQVCPFHGRRGGVPRSTRWREYGPAAGIASWFGFYEDWYAEVAGRRQPEQRSHGRLPTRRVVSGMIQSFGAGRWMLLLAAAEHEPAFSRVIGAVRAATRGTTPLAWPETSIEVYLQHDDMVWTEGEFLHPRVYREVIFPCTGRCGSPSRKPAKKVLFCLGWHLRHVHARPRRACGGPTGSSSSPRTIWTGSWSISAGPTCIVGQQVDAGPWRSATWEQVKGRGGRERWRSPGSAPGSSGPSRPTSPRTSPTRCARAT